MDVSRYLDLKPAPLAVFDSLKERRARPRFMMPTPDGDWAAITWGKYARDIRRAATFLRASGVVPGDRAAIYALNRYEWAVAALAIQAAGGVLVPVYPGNTAEQAGYVVEHCDAKVLFVDTPALLERVLQAWSQLHALTSIVLLADIDAMQVLGALRQRTGRGPSFAEVQKKLVGWRAALDLGHALDAEDPGTFDAVMRGIDLDQPGMMLYTSGTTGNPKGVPLTHRNVGVNGADWLKCNHALIDEDAVDLLWLPMSHIFGFGELCLGNTLGFTTYWADPHTVLARLPEVRPSVFMSVPSYWEKLAQAAMDESTRKVRKPRLQELTGGNLRFCLSGGAGLKREIKEQFFECGVLLVEGYGLTETSPTLTLNRPDDFDFDTVGKPLPSVELKLADDGEILAKGANVFRGYHKDPAATKAAFTADGWFKTGDVGQWTPDGFLKIVDRKKDILVLGNGKNVPPANIELRFRDDPLIEHLVVYGDGKKYLVAGVWVSAAVAEKHVAPSMSAEAKRELLRALVQDRIERVNKEMASFETIKRFQIIEHPLTVDNGLLTASLKVKRKMVYERFKEQLEGLYDAEAPARAQQVTA